MLRAPDQGGRRLWLLQHPPVRGACAPRTVQSPTLLQAAGWLCCGVRVDRAVLAVPGGKGLHCVLNAVVEPGVARHIAMQTGLLLSGELALVPHCQGRVGPQPVLWCMWGVTEAHVAV